MEENVINYVQMHREKAGLTQEELAQGVGITRQTVISIEKGNYSPSVLLALKIAVYFNQPVEKIFILSSQTRYAKR